MRRNKGKVGLTFLLLSMVGFLLFSISFVLVPKEQFVILPGLLFYGGLIVGISFQVVLEIKRKAFFKKHKVKQSRIQKPRNGLFSFGSNRIALVVDSVLIASAIVTALAFIFPKSFGNWCFVCISVLMFSFCAHCVFNGRNFFHINNQDKVRQMLESKKESTLDKGEGKK